VIVHDSKEDYTGGQVHMYISGNMENAVVTDGRDSSSKHGPSDRYIYLGQEKDATELFWEWGWQSGTKKYRTDGIADYWDSHKRPCVTLSAKFIKGIDAWRFVPGPNGKHFAVNPDDYLYLDMDDELKVCMVSAAKRQTTKTQSKVQALSGFFNREHNMYQILLSRDCNCSYDG
jgi:hypothetical protein